MSFLVLLCVLILISAAIYFIDHLLRSCMLFPYIQFMHSSGIVIKPFTICLEISRFNNDLRKLGRIKPKFLRTWFQLGAYLVTCIIIPVFLYFSWEFIRSYNFSSLNSLAFNNHEYVKEPAKSSPELVENLQPHMKPLLTPVLPGINLPNSHIPYYIFTLFLCMTFHEFGHALAASREKVSIDGCGIALILIFPVAYVRLCQEHLQQSSPWQQIRIYSAGIWHNVVLALFAVFLAAICPFILSPLFETGKGITALHIDSLSGLARHGGLEYLDQVFKVGNCSVKSLDDWTSCIKHIERKPQHGFCSEKEFILTENKTSMYVDGENCCLTSNTHLCFHHEYRKSSKLCLPGRKVIEKNKICFEDFECHPDQICIIPIISEQERLIRIERRLKPDVIYVGTTYELRSSVTLSQWTAKTSFFSIQYIEVYGTLLFYLYIFSAGLAIVNVIPSYGLDGQYLCVVLVHYFLSAVLPKHSDRLILINILRFCGTFLLMYIAYTGLTNLKLKTIL